MLAKALPSPQFLLFSAYEQFLLLPYCVQRIRAEKGSRNESFIIPGRKSKRKHSLREGKDQRSLELSGKTTQKP